MLSLKLTPLQCRFAATLGATLLLFAFYLVVSNPSFAYAAELIPIDSENKSSLIFIEQGREDDGHGFPFLPEVHHRLEDEDGTDVQTPELARRVPPGVSGLGNNQFQQRNLEIGETQWWYFPKDAVNGNKTNITSGLPAYLLPERVIDDDVPHELKRRDGGISKRSSTVYLSLTTCLKPNLNTTATGNAPTLPQLEVYVSTSESLQKPGPGNSQSVYYAVEGYVGTKVEADGDVYIGVTAPNSTAYSGIYNYQIAVSIDGFFHSVVDDDPFLYFIDSDTDAALLVTNNLTQSSPISENYKQWMNITPPYTMFANNINSSSITGLKHSYCALASLAQISKSTNNIEAGMTSRGLGNKPKEQFYVTGLNRSSTYYGILAMNGNSTSSGNGVVGGGGRVWKAMNFTTKADDNCAVLFNLSFCSEVAYAVPSNPSLDVSRLSSIYDDYAASMYKNFNYSLQQVQCNASENSMFSFAVGCDDCAAAYKEWLCAVSIPRCYDYSSNFSYLQVRNAGQAFLNGSSISPTDSLRQNPATNKSRNSLIDSEINPGPYKEILPCQDICYNLVRSCPASLGFACPQGRWLNSSYGWRDPNGDITCSYLGAAYYLNAGWNFYGDVRLIIYTWGVAWALFWTFIM